MWTITRSEPRPATLLGLTLALLLLIGPVSARADEPAEAKPARPASEPTPPSATTPSATTPSPGAPPDPDPLDSLRDRFREGMNKYKAGAFADAILIWESIYRELGPDMGYRLAFDLARAYEQLGGNIKAADHYDTYLEKVRERRANGEQLEPNVARQEEIARERRDTIVRAVGRIQVSARARGTAVVRIDNAPPRVAPVLVYVEPGSHAVSIDAGNGPDVRTIRVGRGQLASVDPREESPLAAPTPGPAAAPTPAPTALFETRVERPFSPIFLWVGAGVAALSVIVPVLTYDSALSIKTEHDDPNTSSTDRSRLASDYESARTNAYASIGVPALFTAAVGALSLWYVLGAKETRVPITPSAVVGPKGASLGASGSF